MSGSLVVSIDRTYQYSNFEIIAKQRTASKALRPALTRRSAGAERQGKPGRVGRRSALLDRFLTIEYYVDSRENQTELSPGQLTCPISEQRFVQRYEL